MFALQTTNMPVVNLLIETGNKDVLWHAVNGSLADRLQSPLDYGSLSNMLMQNDFNASLDTGEDFDFGLLSSGAIMG